MIRICFSAFLSAKAAPPRHGEQGEGPPLLDWHFSEISGYGSANKSVSLNSNLVQRQGCGGFRFYCQVCADCDRIGCRW
jgi:hypothetical protein